MLSTTSEPLVNSSPGSCRATAPHREGEIAPLATDYCLLSDTEAARLEHWGIRPACKAHRHIKKREALEMIQADTHRQVGGEDTHIKTPISMIVPVNTTRLWQPVQARNADGSRVMGLRTWGLKPLR